MFIFLTFIIIWLLLLFFFFLPSFLPLRLSSFFIDATVQFIENKIIGAKATMSECESEKERRIMITTIIIKCKTRRLHHCSFTRLAFTWKWLHFNFLWSAVSLSLCSLSCLLSIICTISFSFESEWTSRRIVFRFDEICSYVQLDNSNKNTILHNAIPKQISVYNMSVVSTTLLNTDDVLHSWPP